MSKNYKVSYKTYLNDRLKEVFFNGRMTYPLYIQVTFERRTIFFKSYYFELLSEPRYATSAAGRMRGPSMDEITAKENELIGFIVDRHPDDFSFELFKKEYASYNKDLCDVMESNFVDYLRTFFQDKGMPYLATVLREGSKFRVAYDVVRDMKIALNRPLYDELVENSLYYASPYLPLYGFMTQVKKWPLLTLSVMDWETGNTKEAFSSYIQKHYPEQDADEIKKQMERWVKSIKEQNQQ